MSVPHADLHITSCQDLYDLVTRTPAGVFEATTDLDRLSTFYTTHVPEIQLWRDGQQERVTVTTVELHHFDERRFWFLGVVSLDHVPFMVIQNAGREGDDFNRRYVTAKDRYREAVRYLVDCGAAQMNEDPPNPYRVDERNVVNATDKVSGVTCFDGHSLNEIRRTPNFQRPD